MILRRWSTVMLAALVVSCACTYQSVANRQENNLGVVRFPEPWTKKTADGRTVALTDVRGFAVRKTTGTQPDELIFSMTGLISTAPNRSEMVNSEEFFAISLDRKFRVRTAAREEWERAAPIPNTRNAIPSNNHRVPSAPATHTENEVIYQGKKFSKSGEYWGNPVGLVSPNRAWLAVFSFSSSAKPTTSWSPLDGGMLNEPRPGELLIDVYDTSSGQRVQKSNLHYESSPSILFGGALWAGDSFLIVPLDPIKDSDLAGQACFLVILPTH